MILFGLAPFLAVFAREVSGHLEDVWCIVGQQWNSRLSTDGAQFKLSCSRFQVGQFYISTLPQFNQLNNSLPIAIDSLGNERMNSFCAVIATRLNASQVPSEVELVME